MRISDLSSDVCSSDLGKRKRGGKGGDRIFELHGITLHHARVRRGLSSRPKPPIWQALNEGSGDAAWTRSRIFVLPVTPDLIRGDGEDHRALQRRTWDRSEEHTSELQSLMRISYAVFCLKKKKQE